MPPLSVLMGSGAKDMTSLARGLELVMGWLMPLSAIGLCIFPLALFASFFLSGLRARPGRASAQYTEARSAKALQDALPSSWSLLVMSTAAVAAAMPLLLIFPSSLLGFVHARAHLGAFPGSALLEKGPEAAAISDNQGTFRVAGTAGPCVLTALLGSTVGLVAWRRHSCVHAAKASSKKSRSWETLRCCASNKQDPVFESETAGEGSTLWYSTPVDSEASPWHHVDLKVRDWLDHETGDLRYINEMPRGCLQKFEVQTRLEKNVIREDAKGSKKLQAFGRALPFSYGCFPQTFRDARERDEVYDAPGDDDPLDVINLGAEASCVGQIVRCRPLGAVCLIDQGQADWKILVVSTELQGPLAAARSIEDVERLWPGRVAKVLQWLDEFKQYSSGGQAKLHFEIHDAAKARALIEKDHQAWKRLVAEAQSGGQGQARGHWISQAGTMECQTATLLGLETAAALSPVLPGRGSSSLQQDAGTLAGSSAKRHSLAPRRCFSRSTSSDDASSSSRSEHSPVASDTEPGN